ncbi:MAG TPA: hypothetical protein VI306_09905 [Pyrinomonadaceae bacterium]
MAREEGLVPALGDQPEQVLGVHGINGEELVADLVGDVPEQLVVACGPLEQAGREGQDHTGVRHRDRRGRVEDYQVVGAIHQRRLEKVPDR